MGKSIKGNKNFELHALTEKDWNNFAFDVIVEYAGAWQDARIIKLTHSIKDNVAHFKLQYQTNKFNEIAFHVDKFGVIEDNYQGNVSAIFRGIMSEKYGADYDHEVEGKFGVKLDI